jgi:energy-coupling factor transport system ATP-binding protein
MVFQEPEHQFLTSNVKKELLVLSKRLKIDSVSAEAIADELLEKFRLTHLSDFNPFTLSGGEKRRLSVAAALVTDPKLLILDEPTFGQDANTFYELVRLLEEKKENGQAVVMVTHDLELLYLLADKVVELENGFVAKEQCISPVPRTRADLTIVSDLC